MPTTSCRNQELSAKQINTAPCVSIIIPTYNCAYLDQAIESALSQTHPNVEVIVVDDGSTKHRERVEPYLNRVRYFRKANGGTGSALNCGIANARGEYFSWLSSDDLYEPEKLSHQLAFMSQRCATVSYTYYQHIDPAGQPLHPAPPRPSFSTRMSFLRSMQRGCHIHGCSMLFPLRVFSEVGGFDESLRFTQDYDMWLRILRRYEIHYLDEPLVRYRVHEAMTTRKCETQLAPEVAFVRRKHRWALYGLMAKEWFKRKRASV